MQPYDDRLDHCAEYEGNQHTEDGCLD
jgi:hypothetical protein